MKMIATIAMLITFAAVSTAQDCTFTIADDDTLQTAASTFHDVMAPLWHGPVQDGKTAPVKEQIAELIAGRDLIMKAHLPEEYRHECAAFSAMARQFSDSVDKLDKLIKDGAADETVAETFAAMHMYFERMMRIASPIDSLTERFHEVMQPLWHESYPARDVAAIKAGIPELSKWAEAIAKANMDKCEECQVGTSNLSKAVELLRKSADGGEEAAVLEALEKVHDAYHALDEDHEEEGL